MFGASLTNHSEFHQNQNFHQLSLDHVLYRVQEQFFSSVCNDAQPSIFLRVGVVMFGNIKFLSYQHPFYSKERQKKSFLHTGRMSTIANKKLNFLLYMSRVESNEELPKVGRIESPRIYSESNRMESESRFSISFRSLV